MQTRREFLKIAGAAAAATLANSPVSYGLKMLQPLAEVSNPLEQYPARDWEKLYRDIYSYDSSFVFLCAPNDTHNCLLRAYVKNGVVTRIGPTFGYGKADDIYGNTASARWDPRCCQKGLALGRRVYGDRRVKYPVVRKGFKEWVEKGFPRDGNGRTPAELFNRGKDRWVKVSWDEAYELAAKTLINVTKTYNGESGAELLKKQGYDPAMIEKMAGVGTQVLKFRGGMPLLGITRVFGMYRVANSIALLDSYLRGVTPDKAVGGKGWDNYSWHTDLPPGHPMVTGQQTVDWDLIDAENAKLIISWGMNWISTKMPDSHWLSEAKIKGAKIVTVACEYQSTSNKADVVVVMRPGSDPVLAYGLAYVIINEKLYDEEYIKSSTDLPLLVRMDNLKLLKAGDIIKDYNNAELKNYVKVLKAGESPPPMTLQNAPIITEELRKEWGDFIVWESKANLPAVVTRDDFGENFKKKGVDPKLEGEFEVTLANGEKVKARTVFDLLKQYIFDNFTPANVSKITWVPEEGIIELARQIAANKGKTLVAVGMGPNHMFNNDIKDRAIFLVCSLTKNIGFHGGNMGSFAGNYRGAYYNGLPQYATEDPFNIELDLSKPTKTKSYYRTESAHYYNYGDKPLRVGNKLFTGKSHVPTPSKTMWFANSNSILGNAKGHYDVVVNTLPKMEMIICNEWWWSASCEYSDIVFPVDSWAEFKFPDMTAAVTNPFAQTYPRTPLARIFDSKGDIETYAGVAKKLAELTGDNRFNDYWKFVNDGKVDVYIQRILNAGTATKGYKIDELEEKAKQGVPALLMTRTYPKTVGWEHTNENKPWYTKTGRLEFYRDEPEFIEHGENIPVHREPVDATHHEPNVIVAKQHPVIKPTPPEAYGLSRNDLSTNVRQVRNVVVSPEELTSTKHPRIKDGFTHVYLTPKYRHGAHTTPVDTDLMAVWFGPFGDFYRRDKRKPWVGEGYVDINPDDAKALGIEDGDYVWIDADLDDRPYRGAKPGTEEYKLSRCMLRARYYGGTPRGIARSWFNMYGATYGSIKGHETREDKLARNPETNYQAMFRYGSHQSATRAWLKPTLMTDTLVRKEYFGQTIGKGFAADIHCTTGAPKESFIKFTKAEDGGINGSKLWQPAALGYRPTYENSAMKKYLGGEFIL